MGSGQSQKKENEGEKYLVLKKKYRMEGILPGLEGAISSDMMSVNTYDDMEPPPYKPPPPPQEPATPILPPIVHHSMDSPAGKRPHRHSPVGSYSISSTDSPSRSRSVHDSPMSSRPSSVHHDSPMSSRPSSVHHDSPMSSRPSSVHHDSPSSSRSSSVHRDSPMSSRPSSVHREPSLHSSRSSGSLRQDSSGDNSRRSSVFLESSSSGRSGSLTDMPLVGGVPRRSLSSQDSPFITPPTSPIRSPSEPPPPVPPRRKSSDKIGKGDNKENETASIKRPKSADNEKTEVPLTEDNKISVRERMQKFNRLASESAINDLARTKKRLDKHHLDRDEDDSASVNSLQLDPKFREWSVKCSQGDYQAVAKMAAENPRLIKLKNAANGYSALHWAAKHGNLDMIKLVAGTYGANVNQRTNGGYTALHIAMQYGHEDLYNLLVQVYGADANLRDWSGKKARQYLTNKDTSVSADTFRSEYPREYSTINIRQAKYRLSPLLGLARKKHRHVNSSLTSLHVN